VESNGTNSDPLRSPLIRVLGPQFGETVYISEVNGAGKVKSDAQVAMNKFSDPELNFFLMAGRGRRYPQLKFSLCSAQSFSLEYLGDLWQIHEFL